MQNALILLVESDLKYIIVILILSAAVIFATLLGFLFVNRYKAKSRKFDLLINSVPSGVFMCAKDDVLTIKYYNNNFLSIIGYNREELADVRKNSFINLIHKDDLGPAYKSLISQIQENKQFEIKLRIVKNDSSQAWLLWKGRLSNYDNSKYLNCAVYDITESVINENNKRIDEERYRIVAESSDSVIFEYNIKEKTIFYTHKFKQKFGEDPTTENIPDAVIDKGKIHSQDLKTFLSEYNKVLYGKPSGSIELRLKKANGEFFWAQLRYTSIFDQNNMPVKIIGKIIDIDKQKKETESLKKANQMDSFTGLYNKTATLELIEKYINENSEKKHALFFIDIDNFKAVNDSHGHIFGDKILFELSNVIKKQFRHTDLVGRIGGDEFLVLLKDYIDEDFIHEKAEALCAGISAIKSPLKDIVLTASIGITLYPKHGKLLSSLYEKADIALYAAKSEGKNKYRLYSQELALKHYLMPHHDGKATALTGIKKQSIGGFTTFLAEIAECLTVADCDDAINRMLNMLAGKLGADRMYIYEFVGQDKISNTYEWHGKKVKPLKEINQNIDFNKSSYQQNFNEDGFLYCADTDELSGVQEFAIFDFSGGAAVVQCMITAGDDFKGFLGCEIIGREFMITQEEIEILCFAAKALARPLTIKKYKVVNE